MLLVVPSPDCILQFIVQPDKYREDSNVNQNNNYNPKPKKKNEPRKANEAIISDNRFKIDKTNNVIVY
jgi:hypothetical protein